MIFIWESFHKIYLSRQSLQLVIVFTRLLPYIVCFNKLLKMYLILSNLRQRAIIWTSEGIVICVARPRWIHDDVIKWKHFPRYWPFVRGIHRVPGEFPAQRPVTRSIDAFFDLQPNKRLSKQWWGWWFETPSCTLWRHRNVILVFWLFPCL